MKKNTLFYFLIQQFIVLNWVNQTTKIDHMTNITFSFGRSLDCSELFVFLSLSDNEFQKHIFIV